MNAAPAAFRSHLMQQFAAAARSQSRPPLALASVRSKKKQQSAGEEVETTRSTTSSLPQFAASPPLPRMVATNGAPTVPKAPSGSHRSLRSMSATTSSVVEQQFPMEKEQENQEASLSDSMQTLLRTRRSISRFLPSSSTSPFMIREALDRAVLCAQNAPNHYRTEPFSFARMIVPSPKIQQLSEIAYEVTMRKGQRERMALQKQSKWSEIPAYVAVLVENQPNQVTEDGEVEDPYVEMNYVAPETEKQLEDVSVLRCVVACVEPGN